MYLKPENFPSWDTQKVLTTWLQVAKLIWNQFHFHYQENLRLHHYKKVYTNMSCFLIILLQANKYRFNIKIDELIIAVLQQRSTQSIKITKLFIPILSWWSKKTFDCRSVFSTSTKNNFENYNYYILQINYYYLLNKPNNKKTIKESFHQLLTGLKLSLIFNCCFFFPVSWNVLNSIFQDIIELKHVPTWEKEIKRKEKKNC